MIASVRMLNASNFRLYCVPDAETYVLALACGCSGSPLGCRSERHLAAPNATSEPGSDGGGRAKIRRGRMPGSTASGASAATLNRSSALDPYSALCEDPA